MRKIIFFNLLFTFFISAVAFAEGEVAVVDYGKEKPGKSFSLDAGKAGKQHHSLSLKSGMSFKGENLINSEGSSKKAVITYNTISFEKGQSSYLVPVKKKTILNKLTFNPNELLRNYTGK